MQQMKQEFQELKQLESEGTLDEAQTARLAELPNLIIEEAEKLAVSVDKFQKDATSALAQKDHFRTKFEKEEIAKLEAERKLKEGGGSGEKPALDVGDYIDISASLEGLDQREKEYLANQHKLTGKPLGEIRKDENFLLWQSAYEAKVEKEKLALKPNGTQPEGSKPSSFEEKLANATTIAEKEALLKSMGLYDEPRKRADRVDIGSKR